jgi:hypothetical protein
MVTGVKLGNVDEGLHCRSKFDLRHLKRARAAVAGACILGSAASTCIPGTAHAQQTERRESPLSFRIGGAEFTPGGFVDFDNIFRSSPSPGPSPYVAFKVNQAWGRWDCATNAVAGPKACASPNAFPGYPTGITGPSVYWFNAEQARWDALYGSPWPVTGSFSAGIGGLFSDTRFHMPFSTLKTHASGPALNLNGTLNTPFVWFNGAVIATPSGLFGSPGSFTESAGIFRDFGSLTSSSINGATLDVGLKPLSFVAFMPPANPSSIFTGGIVSLFGGYGIFNESLRGTVPGSMEFQVNSQSWQYGRVGVKVEAPLYLDVLNYHQYYNPALEAATGYTTGSVYHPTLTLSAAFDPWVQTQSSAFTGTGTGFQLDGNLSVPFNAFLATPNPALNGVNLDFFAKYSHMCASGDIGLMTPVRFEASNSNASFGVDMRVLFGDIDAPVHLTQR